jgi:hypothetical protein
MILLLTIIIVVLFFLIGNYVWPVFGRYLQLRKDFRTITLLPLSFIPFVGNLHHFDRRPYVFLQSIYRLAKECQNQNKGLFCIWYSLKPILILCSAKGLEVIINTYHLFFTEKKI